jgi:hypothetical protein
MEYGSSQVLLDWLDSVTTTLPDYQMGIDLMDDELSRWDRIGTASVSYEVETTGNLVVSTCRRKEDYCLCCLKCQVPLPMQKSNRNTTSDLQLLWTKLNMVDGQETDQNRKITESDEVVSTAPPSPLIEEELLLDPPINQPLSIRNCSHCQTRLLSAKSILTPPGYCEYSGKLICGQCFEPRQVVLPWRLVRGQSPIRGNVSRKFAKDIIQSMFYIPNIHFDQIIERTSAQLLFRTLDLLRSRRLTFQVCDDLKQEISLYVENLPTHIRSEFSREETKWYSLADLVDVLAPNSGKSIILTALSQINSAWEAHACQHCSGLYERSCVVCEIITRTTDPNCIECNKCDSAFHKKCFEWSCDGCPVCAGSGSLQIDHTLESDIQLDTLVAQ